VFSRNSNQTLIGVPLDAIFERGMQSFDIAFGVVEGETGARTA
jgi:hypothetical protein